ncbi:MAG: family 16 glycoside hydrolase, partial [Saprospiraceae bacterium]
MKNYTLTLLLLVLLPIWGAAQAAKWTKLFDGRTRHGWSQKGGTAPYEVRQAEIVGTCVDQSPNTFLCTDQLYGDFIL